MLFNKLFNLKFIIIIISFLISYVVFFFFLKKAVLIILRYLALTFIFGFINFILDVYYFRKYNFNFKKENFSLEIFIIFLFFIVVHLVFSFFIIFIKLSILIYWITQFYFYLVNENVNSFYLFHVSGEDFSLDDDDYSTWFTQYYLELDIVYLSIFENYFPRSNKHEVDSLIQCFIIYFGTRHAYCNFKRIYNSFSNLIFKWRKLKKLKSEKKSFKDIVIIFLGLIQNFFYYIFLGMPKNLISDYYFSCLHLINWGFSIKDFLNSHSSRVDAVNLLSSYWTYRPIGSDLKIYKTKDSKWNFVILEYEQDSLFFFSEKHYHL